MDAKKSLLKTKLMCLEQEIDQVLRINRKIDWTRDEVNLKIDIYLEDAYRRVKDCMKLLIENIENV